MWSCLPSTRSGERGDEGFHHPEREFSCGSGVSVSYTRDSWGYHLATSYRDGAAGANRNIHVYLRQHGPAELAWPITDKSPPTENVIDWVQNAQYDCRDGIWATLPFSTNLTSTNLTETRSIRRREWPVSVARLGQGQRFQYLYSATHNNGQITQTVDLFPGETVTYQYDALEAGDIGGFGCTRAAARPQPGRRRSSMTAV